MIKRIIGILGTLAVLAIVAFAIMGREGYSSALKLGDKSSTVQVSSEDSDPSSAEQPQPATALPDSVEMSGEPRPDMQ